MAANLPPPTNEERLRELFEKLDINNDGRLELDEIRKALHHQGITTPGVAEVWDWANLVDQILTCV